MSIAQDGNRDPAGAHESAVPQGGSASGIGGFLAWWRDELVAMAPKGLRGTFNRDPEVATVQEVDGQVYLKRRSNASPRALQMGTGKPVANLPSGGVVYLLPEDGALRRERRLPAASRAHIQDIMNLQMASETPFTVDEVYSDSIITGEDDEAREILVSQALAPRAAIDALVQRMRADYGLEITGLDIADPLAANGRVGYNLLPSGKAKAGKGSGITLNRLLILGVLGAGVFAAMSWRDLQERRIASADALIAAAEGNASEALAVNTKITQGVEGIQKVTAETQQPLSFMSAYNLIASLLPDGSWLEEFNYDRPVVVITGLSSNSATLVQAMESSDLVESAKFTSPTVTDPRSGAERFRMAVTFKTPDGAAAPAPAQEPQQ